MNYHHKPKKKPGQYDLLYWVYICCQLTITARVMLVLSPYYIQSLMLHFCL